MKYYIDIFSPETYEAFLQSDRCVSGFRLRQLNTVQQIKVGDIFLCYVTRISRWYGILKILSSYYEDSSPRFVSKNDPYILRFKVKPIVWLPFENAIPIHNPIIWNHLSFTKKTSQNDIRWTGKFRSSLNQLNDQDGKYVYNLLKKQASEPKIYKLIENDIKAIKRHTVRIQNSKEVGVSVPQDDLREEKSESGTQRESIYIQAKLAEIGEKMGMRIWIPKSDRSRVLDIWHPINEVLMEELPLNYDEVTIKTIEQIDVLWLRRRSIVRAFEIEHTTSIYSGILRMADLLALQPNLEIKTHIVAPLERKEKVFQELKRPVFTLLEKGPLAESCTFLSYDTIKQIYGEKHLEHMSDSVLDEYEEFAEEE